MSSPIWGGQGDPRYALPPFAAPAGGGGKDDVSQLIGGGGGDSRDVAVCGGANRSSCGRCGVSVGRQCLPFLLPPFPSGGGGSGSAQKCSIVHAHPPPPRPPPPLLFSGGGGSGGAQVQHVTGHQLRPVKERGGFRFLRRTGNPGGRVGVTMCGALVVASRRRTRWVSVSEAQKICVGPWLWRSIEERSTRCTGS